MLAHRDNKTFYEMLLLLRDVVAINIRLSELAKEMLRQYDIFKNKVCHEALKVRTGSKN